MNAPIGLWRCSLRSTDRYSEMFAGGESNTRMLMSDSSCCARTMSSSCSAVNWPRCRSRSGMPRYADRMRDDSSTPVISWEKNGTDRPVSFATARANWAASAVLPMPGRAATMITCPGWNPIVALSRDGNPVVEPSSCPGTRERACSRNSATAPVRDVDWPFCSVWDPRSKIVFSATDKASAPVMFGVPAASAIVRAAW